MIIHKKEKPLTPEEIREKEKKEIAPYWLNSEILFGNNLYPISPAFLKQTTLLFLLDVADFTTERALEFLQFLRKKYEKLNWVPVLVFQQKYAFLKDHRFFSKFKNIPIFIDPFGQLFERFGSSTEPVVVILKDGEMISSIPLLPHLQEKTRMIEEQVQVALRVDDPGLPMKTSEGFDEYQGTIEQKSIPSHSLVTTGEWMSGNQFIFTENNGASVSFRFSGKKIRLVAMAHPDSKEPLKVIITLDEKPLSHHLMHSLFSEDVKGNTFFEINKSAGFYDLLKSDKDLSGNLKLTFANSYENGALVYGFRIGL